MGSGGNRMSHVVYVYEGPGASLVSSSLLLSALRRCLSSSYHSIQRISPQEIKKGEWTENCSAMVLGGGYDLGFLDCLGQEGADMIRGYVLNGGTYVSMCAGAYFACDYIEFEKGGRIEVCGPRPLKFYPGKCLGSITPNFTYNSERGAAALPMAVATNTIPSLVRDTTLHVYVNGGGFFSPYSSLEEFPHVQGVETLGRFDSIEGRPAAVVKCDVGEKGGVALLSSPHIEFSAFELSPTDKYLLRLQRELRNSDRMRELFFRAFLEKGGLRLGMKPSL